MDPRKNVRREAHGELELVIAFEDVRLAFPTAKSFPIDETLEPGEMAVDGDRIIAAVDHAAEEGFAEALWDVASANGDVEGAVVAVKILEAFGHADENVKVFGVEQAAFGSAMGGDCRDAAFEGQGKDAWIGIFGSNDRKGVFAAGVGEEGQFGLGHAFPEFGEAAIIAVDVVAVGKAFHDGCAGIEAAV